MDMKQVKQQKQMNGGKANLNGGKNLMRAVGMAGTQPAEQGSCRQTQPADSPPGTGLKTTNGPQLAGLAARTAADDVGQSLVVQVSGGSAEVLAAMKAGSDLPTVPTPPNTFACHCPYPLP